MLKSISKKAWIGIGTAVIVAIVAIVLVILLKKDEDSYRQIKVYQVDGKAEVVRNNDRTIEAYKNMNLQSQDLVNTSEDSYLYAELDGDKYILLEPLTKVYIEATGTAQKGKIRIRLEEGAIVNCLDNKLSEGSSYEVNTPSSTMAVRGTSFRIEVTKGKSGECTTKLSVFEGSVGCNLIQPDGSVGAEIPIEKGKNIEILKKKQRL